MKILTLNVRGLNSITKRKLYFKTFIKYGICCLQEAYITNQSAQLWKHEWDGEFFYQPGTNKSGGLIILISKLFCCGDVCEIKINERILGVSFTHNNKNFVIYNIYAPAIKDQRINFLEQLTNYLNPMLNDNGTILCGDFNNLINNNLDNINGACHSAKEVAAFNKLINDFDLIDTWRSQHPYSKEYSWIRIFRNNDTSNQDKRLTFSSCSARRLDYIFINQYTKLLLVNTEMTSFSSTDHKAVIATFKTDNFPRGSGFWKLNTSHLDDPPFLNSMIEFITLYHRELADDPELSKGEVWELLKIGIRDECIAYSRIKKLENVEIENMNDQLHNLSIKLALSPNNIELINKVAFLTSKKEIFELSESNGALKRSKINFIQESEKNTALFLGLEKTKQSQQTITEINNNNGVTVSSPGNILNVLSSFYTELMNDDSDNNNVHNQDALLNAFLNNTELPTLQEDDKVLLDSPLTINELNNALKLLNIDSSPGSDGLSPIFYITFWKELKTPLFESFNESIENQTLTISQRRAILTLLPKSKDKELLKNVAHYRPISLTNTDYKIYSKVLAMRMQTVLKKIIHDNQVGYITGRSINDHIRFIDDMINITNNENYGGMLVSLDYRKAFDTLSKMSIISTLKQFNFGPNYIKYVTTILNNTEASVKNAGWHSAWFSTSRGVRQGCCLSPLLFILVVEILAIKIRKNENIKGILDGKNTIFVDETKLISYADDLTFFLQTTRCLSLCLKEVESFSNFSGLVLNRTKSIGLWLGKDKDNPPGGEDLKWINKTDTIKILGVYFNSSTEASLLEKNWTTRIEQIRNTISQWSKRHISLWGKSIVAKTFLLSKLNYILQSLALPTHILEQIDNIIFKFLWVTDTNKNGFERLNRNTLCLPISEGGVAMISIKDQQKTFLMKWLHRLNSGSKNKTHHKMINYILKKIGGLEYFLNCDISPNQFKGLETIKSHYWKQSIIAWLEFDKSNFAKDNPNIPIPIFNNLNIVYKKQPLFMAKWIKQDLKYVHNFLIENRFKTFEEIRAELGPDGGLIFNYMIIKNAILKSNIDYRQHFVDIDHINQSDFLKTENKTIRNIILKQKINTLKCKDTWTKKLDIDITRFFSLGYMSTQESRLRLLHFKIVHHLYPTNILLQKMKIRNNNKCDKCQEIETLPHLFFNCTSLTAFWKYISELVSLTLETTFSIKVVNALFGITTEDTQADIARIHKANHIMLIAKMCISKGRFSKNKNLRLIFEHEKLLRHKFLT